ncbi:hypothetical protein IMY05_001G0230400 [Salix suchowensis]|nr:hypothetical protein IMY05_001G0230400 [Salix suchowensis]
MYPCIQMLELGSRNNCSFFSKTSSFLSSLWIQVEGMYQTKQVKNRENRRFREEGMAFRKSGVEWSGAQHYSNPHKQLTNAFLLSFLSFLSFKKVK